MLLLKICLVGESFVGKTSIRKRFLGERFDTSYLITIGADFAVKTVQGANETLRFQIWDLAGQAKFTNVRDLYFRGSLGALVVFDITRPETLPVIDKWIDELYKNSGKGSVPIILLGNKSDLKDECEQPVNPDDAATFMNEMKEKYKTDIKYLDTSAKTGLNVEEAFLQLGELILQDSELYITKEENI